MNIYVGNLPYNTSDVELQRIFSTFGSVRNMRIVSDPYTGKPKGFGFVEMQGHDEAQAAIVGLNGKEFKGRTLKVNTARSHRLLVTGKSHHPSGPAQPL